MNINFAQGIISYPTSNNIQSFLVPNGGYITFSAANGSTDVALTHGDTNYLLSETVTIPNAWGPLESNVTYWLYWDINTTTAVRTYGYTKVEPSYALVRPTIVEGLHWFNHADKTMYVAQSGRWRPVIRAFAARTLNSVLTGLGSGFVSRPFAGTQVGLSHDNTLVGRIIIDNAGKPIRRLNSHFFTTEDDFFVGGSPISTVRLESTIITATAMTVLPKYHVVRFTNFNEVAPAEYVDVEETTIAMVMESAPLGATVSLCVQGIITNPEWNWPTVGARLYVTTGGQLTSVDPFLIDPVTYRRGRAPVGRVVSPTSIIFDQGLGAKGDKGDAGESGSGGGTGTTVNLATNTVYGISRLSVPAIASSAPIVVGDNDPRNSNARTPLPHTHPAVNITTSPYLTLTGATLDIQLQELENKKLNVSGGTMTGPLKLAANPILPLEAATKAYVDALPGPITPTIPALSQLTDVTLTSPSNTQVLTYNGSRWVNATAPTSSSGGSRSSFICRFSTLSALSFGSAPNGVTWAPANIILASPDVRFVSSGYSGMYSILNPGFYAVTLHCAMMNQLGAWPDGSVLFGTSLQTAAGNVQIEFVGEQTSVHHRYSPRSGATSDSNTTMTNMFADVDRTNWTDSYVVSNPSVSEPVNFTVQSFLRMMDPPAGQGLSIKIMMTITKLS